MSTYHGIYRRVVVATIGSEHGYEVLASQTCYNWKYSMVWFSAMDANNQLFCSASTVRIYNLWTTEVSCFVTGAKSPSKFHLNWRMLQLKTNQKVLKISTEEQLLLLYPKLKKDLWVMFQILKITGDCLPVLPIWTSKLWSPNDLPKRQHKEAFKKKKKKYPTSPAPWKRNLLSTNFLPVMRRLANTPAAATAAVPKE